MTPWVLARLDCSGLWVPDDSDEVTEPSAAAVARRTAKLAEDGAARNEHPVRREGEQRAGSRGAGKLSKYKRGAGFPSVGWYFPALCTVSAWNAPPGSGDIERHNCRSDPSRWHSF